MKLTKDRTNEVIKLNYANFANDSNNEDIGVEGYQFDPQVISDNIEMFSKKPNFVEDAVGDICSAFNDIQRAAQKLYYSDYGKGEEDNNRPKPPNPKPVNNYQKVNPFLLEISSKMFPLSSVEVNEELLIEEIITETLVDMENDEEDDLLMPVSQPPEYKIPNLPIEGIPYKIKQQNYSEPTKIEIPKAPPKVELAIPKDPVPINIVNNKFSFKLPAKAPGEVAKYKDNYLPSDSFISQLKHESLFPELLVLEPLNVFSYIPKTLEVSTLQIPTVDKSEKRTVKKPEPKDEKKEKKSKDDKKDKDKKEDKKDKDEKKDKKDKDEKKSKKDKGEKKNKSEDEGDHKSKHHKHKKEDKEEKESPAEADSKKKGKKAKKSKKH